jgi:3-hydroxyacyl-CoA dehydrogenase
MGAGIVQIAAQSGYKVTMVDTTEEAINKGTQTILKSLTRIAKKNLNNNIMEIDNFINSIKQNISTSLIATDAVKHSDLVIEAIIENMPIKQKLWKELVFICFIIGSCRYFINVIHSSKINYFLLKY